MPNSCELVEQLEFSHFAGGSVNWYNHIGTYLSVVTKAAHMTTLSNSTLRYMPYNPCSTKGVPRSTINNDLKLETEFPSTVKQMNKWRDIPCGTTHIIMSVSKT